MQNFTHFLTFFRVGGKIGSVRLPETNTYFFSNQSKLFHSSHRNYYTENPHLEDGCTRPTAQVLKHEQTMT